MLWLINAVDTQASELDNSSTVDDEKKAQLQDDLPLSSY